MGAWYVHINPDDVYIFILCQFYTLSLPKSKPPAITIYNNSNVTKYLGGSFELFTLTTLTCIFLFSSVYYLSIPGNAGGGSFGIIHLNLDELLKC